MADKKKAAQQPEETTADMPVTETEVNEATVAADEIPDEITITRAEFEEVKAHIDTLKKENATTVALAQRVQADFDNFRRRNATISADSRNDGARDVIAGLLPVIDNFDRALTNTDGVNPAWLEGIRLVHRQMMETLQKYGMEEIPSEGAFDPNLHEAVLQEEKEGANSGDIIETLQKGYKVKDRIIRPSMVKVAK